MKKLLIANRGEIARRILKACREKNISVAVIATIDDKTSLVCQEADAVLEVSSFLHASEIIDQAKKWGADLLHPGYGFLSENSAFAELCEKNQIAFIGPTSQQIKLLGSKESSKKIAQECKVPTLSSLSSTELKNIPSNLWEKEFEKRKIYSPYLIKASGGGGGRGMRIVKEFNQLSDQLQHASQEALSAFNDDTVFVERYLSHPRHIEIQVFGDGKGGGVFFGERECSLQRRHQKVIEEAPSTIVSSDLREKMGHASLALVKYAKYRGAGTVEFLFDEKHNFYFLEMNTRLQVEHPVTEIVYHVDLVHAQIDLALGIWPFDKKRFETPIPEGVALEARILAEDPRQNFMPTPGVIEEYIEPQGDGIRIDSGVQKGSSILPQFDSMIAKLIAYAPTRAEAVQKLQIALEQYIIFGITTNIPFLIALTKRKEFIAGEESTHFIEENLSSLNQPLIERDLIEKLNSFSYKEKLFNSYLIPHNKEKILEIYNQQNFVFSQNHQNTPTALKLCEHNVITFLNSKNQIEVNIHGEHIILENPGLYKQIFSSTEQDSCKIKAPMAGKVYDVKVKNGDNVTKGDLLFIIESMKMQIEIPANMSGTVKDISVTKNEILVGKTVLGTIVKA